MVICLHFCCEMSHMMKNNKDLLRLTLSNNYNASFVLYNFAILKVSQFLLKKITLIFIFFLILFASTTWKVTKFFFTTMKSFQGIVGSNLGTMASL